MSKTIKSSQNKHKTIKTVSIVSIDSIVSITTYSNTSKISQIKPSLKKPSKTKLKGPKKSESLYSADYYGT